MKITQITENISHTSKRLHDIEKEKGVKPGTPEWFKLWFSLPYLKESITEAFDNPYPYTWDSTHDRYAEFGNDSFLAKAEMDMGELLVMFTLGKPGVSWTIDFAVDGSMDKTGDGDQFRIFATVVAVIKDWMANKVDLSKVTQIDFSSDKDGAAEDSRSKLYKRFGQQLASKLGWNLEVTDRGQFASFKIKNPNAPVEEAVNEATEMKISDLTISDAGMAIAQSVGGGSRTDAPLAVTKLPSGHVYLVNGYHRLVDAMQAGKDTVLVEYVPYEKVEILWKQEREQDIKYGKQFNEEVEVSLHGDAKKGYVLSKIEVSGDERNAGQGTKAMQDIVDRMDREGAIIALTPDSAFGGNKNRLIKFYKRFGFVPNKGMNKDYRFRETMIRYPQSNESVMEADTLTLPKISVGDQVMVGKFKNRKAEVKGFTKDKHNQPVLKTTKGDQKLFKPRISKLIVDETIDPILVENLIGKTLQWAATKGYNITKSMVQGWLKSAPPGASPADAADLITKGIATVGSGAAAISQRKNPVEENFKDGKVKGKSRPGRVKKSGASCNGSVTELRAKAKKASGEKAKMYHWCANMKSGKKK